MATTLCRALLSNAQGQVLAMATAACRRPSPEDLEALEIAARRRLLAALGFDEDAEPTVSVPEEPAPDRPVPSLPAVEDSPTPSLMDERALSLPSGTDATDSSVLSLTEVQELPTPPPSLPDGLESPVPVAAVSGVTEDRALAGLRRQMAHQARLKGRTAPTVTTRAEAQAALRALMAG